ncbi:tRNA lysidine(34) synthetase TilS [Candidatus Palibaumannia cicadellinicola]|uniref:tRNA(Ile)-lysidine synthase n=1 Tax=Baumannia cicadellinicola subsp. Homalodisca coagulata TaxID=374463 RepID=Q1LTY9_BAUCH|nr:tRNA lysidine(34) synthetase TilS [Candidatus Baumannia cicadellinicola]ABF14172.1 tRNA(Ile)-lysidine synthetase [Baumannia cicadellinicola str. Hc (Homalodisca coagulata)]MBS0032630.1 tRNA lysidine(34) synthetase TilS [Candidatus Baumannia cicadellinicola]MCJ7462443.1 tRNA lysidine(34) synthetase TilS [Candidatus Baumannia cicadellinicola]MCJ7462631.1 tRNA lysidine(34) synthetase TilS [Candidatus Baumannia cicadellinicola]
MIPFFKLQEILQQRVVEHINGYSKLVLAFSGGLDSTVLLDILTSLRDTNNSKITALFSLRAVHINHGFNSNSDDWQIHCEQQCRQRAVPYHFIKVRLKTKNNGVEAAARYARYQALYDVLKPGEILLTAQHQDDQVETLLLAIKRGSGPTGLSGMATNANWGDYRLIRPLLTCSRMQLNRYASYFNLNWIEDDSNKNDRFDRNFLRLHIIIQLQKRWPQFSKSAIRSAQLCAEQENLLDELLKDTLDMLIMPDGSLQFTPLLTMSDIKRNALLRRWLASQGAWMPSRQQLTHIWKNVVLSSRAAMPQFILGDKLLRRFRNKLYLLSKKISVEPTVKILLWQINSNKLELPSNIGCLLKKVASDVLETTSCIIKTKTELISIIRAPQPYEQVSVRFNQVDGLLYILGRSHGRPLKKIWQELAIPPWQRRRIPLLFYGQKLITAPGIFVTQDGVLQKNCTKWYLHWLYFSSEMKVTDVSDLQRMTTFV